MIIPTIAKTTFTEYDVLDVKEILEPLTPFSHQATHRKRVTLYQSLQKQSRWSILSLQNSRGAEVLAVETRDTVAVVVAEVVIDMVVGVVAAVEDGKLFPSFICIKFEATVYPVHLYYLTSYICPEFKVLCYYNLKLPKESFKKHLKSQGITF